MLPRFRSDRGLQPTRGRFLPLLPLLALLTLSGNAAQFSGELTIEEYTNLDYSTRDGRMSLDNVLISHGADTRIEARHALRTERPGRVNYLELSGGVHIKFRDSTLEADTAEVLVRGEDLISVNVKGSQATFSHQLRGYARRIDGRADAITFDPSSGRVSFSGNTSYTDGRQNLTEETLIYNINDGTVRDDGDPRTRGRGVIRLNTSDDDRVPAPVPPERSTAQ